MSPLPSRTPAAPRAHTAVEFQGLRDMPPEAEWFANLGHRHATRLPGMSLDNTYS